MTRELCIVGWTDDILEGRKVEQETGGAAAPQNILEEKWSTVRGQEIGDHHGVVRRNCHGSFDSESRCRTLNIL